MMTYKPNVILSEVAHLAFTQWQGRNLIDLDCIVHLDSKAKLEETKSFMAKHDNNAKESIKLGMYYVRLDQCHHFFLVAMPHPAHVQSCELTPTFNVTAQCEPFSFENEFSILPKPERIDDSITNSSIINAIIPELRLYGYRCYSDLTSVSRVNDDNIQSITNFFETNNHIDTDISEGYISINTNVEHNAIFAEMNNKLYLFNVFKAGVSGESEAELIKRQK